MCNMRYRPIQCSSGPQADLNTLMSLIHAYEHRTKSNVKRLGLNNLKQWAGRTDMTMVMKKQAEETQEWNK